MKKIAYSKTALKTLRKIPVKTAKVIRDKIKAYAAGEQVDVTKMKASAYLRIRVGEWRVIMDDNGTVVTILKIGPRGDVYK